MYGCLSNVTQNTFTWQIRNSTNRVDFVDFLAHCLSKLTRVHRKSVINVVVDMHSAHRCGWTVDRIKKMNVNYIIMPGQASQYNPVETSWSIVKREYINLIGRRRLSCPRLTEEDVKTCTAEALRAIKPGRHRALFLAGVKDMIALLEKKN